LILRHEKLFVDAAFASIPPYPVCFRVEFLYIPGFQSTCSLVGLWADKPGWCWFVVRGKHCWLTDKPWLKPTSEQTDYPEACDPIRFRDPRHLNLYGDKKDGLRIIMVVFSILRTLQAAGFQYFFYLEDLIDKFFLPKQNLPSKYRLDSSSQHRG